MPGNDRGEDLVKDLSKEVKLENYIPRYANQAIRFTGEDMGSDRAMMELLLYIMMVIIAFVFGVTIGNTISQEAPVIGTLRAMGYTKGELIRHYMAMPLLVTLISAVIGNILGYTFLKDVCANMYYNSYSLPTYITIWNADDDLSDRDHGSSDIQYSSVEAGTHALAVPQKAAAKEADEEGFSSECPDSVF